MSRLAFTPAALAVLTTGLGGCFFFGDINREPRAAIEQMPLTEVLRGEQVGFRATEARDPDGEPVELVWRARLCLTDGADCEAPFVERTTSDPQQVFAFAVPAYRDDGALPRALEVALEVSDGSRAVARDSILVVIDNRAPTVELAMQGPFDPLLGGGFPVGTPVRLHAVGADGDPGDTEALTFGWALVPARGIDPAAARLDPDPEAPEAADRRQFLATAPGDYTLRVNVRDPLGASGEIERQLIIRADAPPCIAQTSPIAHEGVYYVTSVDDGPRRLAVTRVTDDLDRWPGPGEPTPPLGRARFRWAIAGPGDAPLTWIEGHSLDELIIDPALHAPGARIEVRVEVADRVERTLPCADDSWTCSLGGDPCLQRVTWGLELR